MKNNKVIEVDFEAVLHPTPEQIAEHIEECRAKGYTIVEDDNSNEAKLFDLEVEQEQFYALIYEYINETNQSAQFAAFLQREIEKDKKRDWRKRRPLDMEFILLDYK